MHVVSYQGRALIEGFEGLSLTAYLCPAGVWTIGYGHTHNVVRGQILPTKADADWMLSQDLVQWGADVSDLLGEVATTQNQFDAMVSLAFNIGVAGFAGSTVLRLHKRGDSAGAARAFSMWNKATINGQLQEVEGLTRRRASEANVYLTPDAAAVVAVAMTDVDENPMVQAVAKPQGVMSSKVVLAGGASVVAGGASVVDQISQLTTTISAITVNTQTIGHTIQQVSPVILAVIALGAVCYMVYRYIKKKRNGEIISS